MTAGKRLSPPTPAKPVVAWRHRLVAASTAVSMIGLVSGCSLTPPKPWEKDLLSRPAMSMQKERLERGFTSQVYESKENSSGGDGAGGSGCGCN